MASSTPEGAALKAVCEFLSLQERLGRCWYNRQNNGGTYDPARRVFRTPNGIGYKHGAPDIVACIQGRYVAIEVKAEKGRQSEHQRVFEAGLQKAGGLYVVARSVDDVATLFSDTPCWP